MKKNIDIKKMCEPLIHILPKGWSFLYQENENGVVINAENKGYMTVNFDSRNFKSGFSFVRGGGISEKTYTGKKWKELIISDACKYLENVLK